VRNHLRLRSVVMSLDEQCVALRSGVQRFVRGFGLLSEAETPCGQPLQLSHAHALLVVSGQVGRTLHQKDLAEALALDKSSIARLCARMEREGHIVQRRSDVDGRAREIELTPKGERVARQLDEASRARFSRLLLAIPERQRARVLEALELLNRAARALEPESVS
jgi:DNA-binding MarR family transcriptional regulator